MTRAAVLFLSLLVGGCDYINPLGKCLTTDVGCELPGDYRLVSIDGEAATGALTISSGQFERDGYLDLPTGHERFPSLRGPYLGSILTQAVQDEDPDGFELQATMETEVFITANIKTSASVEGDRLTLRVRSTRARNRTSGGDLDFPALSSGAVLVFRRQ